MGWVVALGNRRRSPPFGTVNAGAFLRNPNTHTYSLKSHVKTPNRWLRLISASLNLISLHVASNTKCRTGLGSDTLANFYEFPDRCTEFNTDPQLCTQEGLPSSLWDVT